MSMKGYFGSPAENEDRREGFKKGCRIRYPADPEDLFGQIVKVIDDDGDPLFEIEFDQRFGHKNMMVSSDEIVIV